MITPAHDDRGPDRRASDERIAAEPQLGPINLPSDTIPLPVEAHLARYARRPIAVAGVVENGMVRPLDPTVKLTESTRVIIVATEER
jgi:hypothetical protein